MHVVLFFPLLLYDDIVLAIMINVISFFKGIQCLFASLEKETLIYPSTPSYNTCNN